MRSRTLPCGDVFRARLILMLAAVALRWSGCAERRGSRQNGRSPIPAMSLSTSMKWSVCPLFYWNIRKSNSTSPYVFILVELS